MPEELLHFVEEFALAYEGAGLPRSAGRILGWLMVCDPPEQNAAQLAQVLGASKASISTMTRLLVQMHLIERVPRRGSRQAYFRIRPGTWSERVRQGLAGLSLYKNLAEKGLKLLEKAPPAQRQRLEEMRDLYAFFEEELQGLFERYQRRKGA
ncbi:GbsR/MarR family transcriptional regulator [Meiothermus rufus]|uniref:GbsR/MarR family transcriptional regulator n=1 Tax=Meiothermus rufus TaxID=604332 RepID=UPI0003FE345D|nr:MarR family transcriptional regulator [Meiothermus rufus]